nr:uncharacterized protein LOC123755717 [Procambarus clarkii]
MASLVISGNRHYNLFRPQTLPSPWRSGPEAESSPQAPTPPDKAGAVVEAGQEEAHWSDPEALAGGVDSNASVATPKGAFPEATQVSRPTNPCPDSETLRRFGAGSRGGGPERTTGEGRTRCGLNQGRGDPHPQVRVPISKTGQLQGIRVSNQLSALQQTKPRMKRVCSLYPKIIRRLCKLSHQRQNLQDSESKVSPTQQAA